MRFAPLHSVGKVRITLLRKQSGQYVKGRFVESTEEEQVHIFANIQPAKYHELLLLPEGLRTSKSLRLYSTSEIKMLREGDDGWPADEFIYKGERYKVFRSQEYEMGILNHWKAIAHRIEITP